MHYVHVEAVRWIDEDWPGWVEVHLNEADGTVVSLIDKVPVFDDADRLAPGVEFPVGLEFPCDVLEWARDQVGNRLAVIRLHFSVEDENGRTIFTVGASTLTSRP
ncbi:MULTISPECIES: hypothetical protein [unclassified Micromonospora]|uniref:hypothetical protein n=1 Tax=unclassified Micromonospora TaxID=2617518 RepID=UPI0032505DDD